MKKAIRPGFGTDGLLLWRKVKLLRCGDGELCTAGEKNVVCLRQDQWRCHQVTDLRMSTLAPVLHVRHRLMVTIRS